MAETLTQFDYLLNAMTEAGRHDKPAEHGYGAKRRALYAHVRELERLAAQAQAAAQVQMTPLDESIIQSACPFDDGRDAETWLSAVEWYEAYRGIGAPK